MKSSKCGAGFYSLYELLKLLHQTKYLYPSINKTWWQKNRQSVSLQSAMISKMSFVVCLFFRKAWVSESQHMEPSHLRRWGHPVTVGTAQCDRCSCRPARQANKTIPLICHLIPLSTGLQSQSMHNMLIIYRHLEKKNLCVYGLMGSF